MPTTRNKVRQIDLIALFTFIPVSWVTSTQKKLVIYVSILLLKLQHQAKDGHGSHKRLAKT